MEKIDRCYGEDRIQVALNSYYMSTNQKTQTNDAEMDSINFKHCKTIVIYLLISNCDIDIIKDSKRLKCKRYRNKIEEFNIKKWRIFRTEANRLGNKLYKYLRSMKVFLVVICNIQLEWKLKKKHKIPFMNGWSTNIFFFFRIFICVKHIQ